MVGHKLYFIGNVFNKDNEVAKYDDRGFAFSDSEKREVELVGLPIQIEHDDKLCVGHVRQSWYENGERWVLGDIDREGLEGFLAAKAVKNKFYTGLSLQHISYEQGGEQFKVPVEVSLCEDPRRPDCRVRHHTASVRDPYFRIAQRLSKMNTETHVASAEVPSVPSVPSVPPAAILPVDTTDVDDQNKQMEVIVAQQKQIDQQQGELEATLQKLARFEKEQAAEIQAQQARAQQKLSGISESLLTWCGENNFDLTDSRVEKLSQLATNHPQTAEILFEIAHCASNKHRESIKELAMQKKVNQNAILREKVESVFERRQNAAGPVTHVASAAGAPALTVRASAAPAASAAPVNHFLNPLKRKVGPSDAYGIVPSQQLLDALKRRRTTSSGRSSIAELYQDLC